MTVGRIQEGLDHVLAIIQEWELPARVTIERAITFTRTDGRDMLYVKAAVGEHYLHVEGMLKDDTLGFYAKWTKCPRNKHGHYEEIVGWDNLYNDVPHIHYGAGARRENRSAITWEEIEEYLAAFLREELE